MKKAYFCHGGKRVGAGRKRKTTKTMCLRHPERIVVAKGKCKKCYEELYSNDPKRKRKLRQARMREYGMTVDDYDKMFYEHGGACAICGIVLENGKLCVDHDHKTGEVRGLLCYLCNTGLGYFKDDIERMSNAVQYLQQFLKKP